MKKPFLLIDCRNEKRSEFVVTEGVQPTYALLFLKEGSFRLHMEGKHTVLRAGDCAIFSDDIDFVRSVIDPITFIMLKFRPNPQCPFTMPIPLGKVEFRNRKRFRDSIEKYASLMEVSDPRAVYYKEHLLEDILLQAFAENQGRQLLSMEGSAESTHDTTVIRAAAFIRENLGRKLSVEDVCHAAQTNASTLNFKFRKELGCSVGGFISSERMKKARHMLTNTTYSIGDVAARCGFDNIYYFSNAFRKAHTLSPTAYRQQYR